MKWVLMAAVLIGVGTVGAILAKPATCQGGNCSYGEGCYYDYQCQSGTQCVGQCYRAHRSDVKGICIPQTKEWYE